MPKQLKILVVDDHPFVGPGILNMLTRVLGSRVIVVNAGSLEEALTILSESNDFDIAFLDPGLPGIDDNNEKERSATIERLVFAISPSTRIIVITGKARLPENRKGYFSRVEHYLDKIDLHDENVEKIISGLEPEIGKGSIQKVSYGLLSPAEERTYNVIESRIADGLNKAAAFEELAGKWGRSPKTIESQYYKAKGKLSQ